MNKIETRFWSKVALPGPNAKLSRRDHCWLWECRTTYNSKRPSKAVYGRFSKEPSRYTSAHRFSYELLRGPIPEGLLLRHVVCRNSLCVNPWHLAPGTLQDNAEDRDRDGTTARGERAAASKLTEEQVRAIRRARDAGVPTMSLAETYGVSQHQIYVVTNKLQHGGWAHVV